MKTIKILGRSVPIFALVLTGLAAIGTAALVTYLSNTTTATVNVESPFVIKIVKGAKQSDSTTSVSGIAWNGENSINFGTIQGGETVNFTGYIKNKADVDIAVKDKEVIRHIDLDDMVGLDTEFTFYGARYWRAEGSPARLDTYNDNIELGWDPYYNSSEGGICQGQGDDGPYGADCASGEDVYCAKVDEKCYYISDAIDYQPVNGQLVSDYSYTYPAGLEEIMQVVMTFNPAITPGSYEYSRLITPPTPPL